MIWGLLRKQREAAPGGPALVGKLPCQPDFVREGCKSAATDALDAFLVQATPSLHQSVGVAQLPSLQLCQALPGHAHALVGVCAPSHDAAGRPFPVAIVHAVAPAQLRTLQSEVFWRFAAFVEDAQALIANIETLTLADARAELAALTLSATGHAADSSSSTDARNLPSVASFERALQEAGEPPSSEAQSYALYAVAAAFAAGVPGLTLDCPAREPSCARLWLTLCARVAELTGSTLCILYASDAGRLLVAIDGWHPGQLRAVADPGFSFDQLWPLATAQASARAHAHSALSQASSRLSQPSGVSALELADALAQFSQSLRA
jgi:type VI secretion system ImpM family protein